MTDTKLSNALNIDDLNDDCLIHIFTFLRIPDRLRIERVSKRWQSLALTSWLKVRRFELDFDLHLNEMDVDENDFTTCDANSLRKVLELCGPNLSCITLEHDCIETSEEILSNIYTLCPKIKEIEIGPLCSLSTVENVVHNFTELRSIYIRYTDFSSQNFLTELFHKNQKLSSLTLHDCSFSAECFLHLNHEAIVDLNLRENEIASLDLLVNDIKKFKNLSYLQFGVNEEQISDFKLINEILDAVNPSTLEYLSLHFNFESDLSQVQGLHINRFHNLIELSINGYKQLKKFLDDKILQSIALNCSKLIKLEICDADSITDVGFTYISDLLKIESLRLYGVNISDAVISKIKSLEYLFCYECPLMKNDGFISLIETSKNIKNITLNKCQSINPESLIDSIKKSSNYVLHVHTSATIEGYEHSDKSYSIEKVGKRMKLKIEAVCKWFNFPKICSDSCAICHEREEIYYIE